MPATTPQLATEPQPTGQPVTRGFRREVTNGIVRLLEKGVAPWQKPWHPGAAALQADRGGDEERRVLEPQRVHARGNRAGAGRPRKRRRCG